MGIIVALVLSIHLLFGLFVVELCLRYDEDGRETLDMVRKSSPFAYGFVMLFGAFLWPIAIPNTINRALKRRRSARKRYDEAVLRSTPAPEGAVGHAEAVRVLCGKCGVKAMTFFLSPEGTGKRCAQCGHEEPVPDLPVAYAQAEDQQEIAELSPGDFLCAIPCPRCEGPAKLCKPDERTRGWYRVTCGKGHWGDLRTDSIMVPEEYRVPWKEGA